ncbi:GLUG motif-containing protein [Methanimicrococcus blatticola]|uniref:GLUG motif-containing protein n=1 Tax=Methanimicrococcus blatticola TaxID=91560 RepID=UPI001414D154|nr:GLUG motif-containing protein [Methanimicrococcus blatticola]MBZ3936206.1 hypothetical protein [Methanimicrococcus blatticola]MCC2508449.1 hypothetical protein [Methanimicrococcus blatticola]
MSSYTTGNIQLNDDAGNPLKAGGLVGYSGNGISPGSSLIISSFSAGHVDVVTTSNDDEYISAGGLAGEIYGTARIIDSYATGSVKTTYPDGSLMKTKVGGLVGSVESGIFINSMALNEFVNGSAEPDNGKIQTNRIAGYIGNDADDVDFLCDPDLCAGSCCTSSLDCECDETTDCCPGCWYPLYDDSLIMLNCFGWDLMKNGDVLFEENDYKNGKNITRRQVWNNYPNEPAPWTTWSHPKENIDTIETFSLFRTFAALDNWEQTSKRLNDFSLFKLPVPEFGQGTVEADARHLIPKDDGGNNGNGEGNATIGTGGTKYIGVEEPMGGFEEEPQKAAVSVILLFMIAVGTFCFVRGSDEMDSKDERR